VVAQLVESEDVMSEMGLQSLLRQVLADKPEGGTIEELSDVMLDRIPKRLYKEVIRLLLRRYVRGTLGTMRTRTPMPKASSFPKAITSDHAGGVKSVSRSAKVSAIREGWQKHLDDQIGVGGGQYKPLRSCTYDDLKHAADVRTRQAEGHKAWAARYNGYAALLTDYDVQTFGELPPEVHMSVLGEKVA
jgi:hypothetical protein